MDISNIHDLLNSNIGSLFLSLVDDRTEADTVIDESTCVYTVSFERGKVAVLAGGITFRQRLTVKAKQGAV